MPLPQRHYPNLHAPNAQAQRGSSPEIISYAQSSGVAMRDFTQELNKELRIIVDQLQPAVRLVGNELVGGPADGANAIFVLANSPDPDTTIQVFNRETGGDTKLMVLDVDYSVLGKIITWIEPTTIPQAGDQLVAWYRWTT